MQQVHLSTRETVGVDRGRQPVSLIGIILSGYHLKHYPTLPSIFTIVDLAYGWNQHPILTPTEFFFRRSVLRTVITATVTSPRNHRLSDDVQLWL